MRPCSRWPKYTSVELGQDSNHKEEIPGKMVYRIVRKLDLIRELLLSAAGWLIVAAIALFGFAAQDDLPLSHV
jgi:hypothetical protein